MDCVVAARHAVSLVLPVAVGSPLTEERHAYAALNNCAFVSTANVREDGASRPFTFLMDAAMLGVGVGFDTDGAGTPVKGMY